LYNESLSLSLVPISGIKSVLRYHLEGLDGAMTYPFVASPLQGKLLKASEFLKDRSTVTRRLSLLIWDAYRTRRTQEAIFTRYAHELMAVQMIGYDEARERACLFVSSPKAFSRTAPAAP